MEKIVLASGIKQYEIVNENDEHLAVLTLDTLDDRFTEKWNNLRITAGELGEDVASEIEKIQKAQEENKITDGEAAEKIINLSRNAAEDLAAEVNKLLGDNFVNDFFADHYKLNKDFIPDVPALVGLFEVITPYIETIFKEKARKYSPNNRGRR